jgi:hypothetical protein
MAPRKPRKTETLASHELPETTPSVDPQSDCPLFELPLELREMIYTYVFAPSPECSSDSSVAVAALGGRCYMRSPSSVLLRTCRHINTDAAGMFAWAMRSLTLVIYLSSAKSRGISADGDTDPFSVLKVPRLSDAQLSQLKTLLLLPTPSDCKGVTPVF